MKKVLSLSLFLLSLVFFSCGTTSEATKIDETPAAPNLTDTTELSSQNETIKEEPIVEEEIIDDTVIEENLPPLEELETKKDEDFYPLPDLIEPDVITVPNEVVEEMKKENIETEEEKKEEPILNEEIVVLDELPPLPVLEEENITKDLDKEKTNLPLELSDKDIVLEDLSDIDESVILDEESPLITEEEKTLEVDKIEKEDKKEPYLPKEQTVETEKEVSSIVEDGIAKEELVVEDTEDDEEIIEEVAEEKEEKIVPSRSVTVKRREFIDISYPGTGWIYMGTLDNSKDVTYFGRDLGTKDTNFSLQAVNAGTKILHFYKNDSLTGEYIDDYVEVIILNQIGSNKTHIAAPPYQQAIPPKANALFYEQEAETENENTETASSIDKEVDNDDSYTSFDYDSEDDVIVISEEDDDVIVIGDEEENEEVTTNIDTDTLLKEAKLLYNEKEYSRALEKIEEFLINATKKVDEGLYLKGQILEAKSDIQNIKGAINAYSTLTKDFPASKYWNEANKRIVYLKRFYLEVR